MSQDILRQMLLIEDPSIFKLYTEMTSIATYFVLPVFLIALCLEYFSDMKFFEVIKKLLIISIFITCFYGIHTTAVDLSLKSASLTLKKVSPKNLFVTKWYKSKVRTKKKKDWGFLDAFVIPNLNDLVATTFFVLSKVFIWLLKLIYSTVYHLTYVFAGLTAVLYFLGWTKDALKGTIQSSLWCMILPFVLVAILALVGNSMEYRASDGEIAFSSIDNLIWLFGVTLLLLISPLITYGMIKGDGVQSAGSKMSTMLMNSGTQALAIMPMMTRSYQNAKSYAFRGQRQFSQMKNRFGQLKTSQLKNSNNSQVKDLRSSPSKSTGSAPTLKENTNQSKTAVNSNPKTSNTVNKPPPLNQKVSAPSASKDTNQNQPRIPEKREVVQRRGETKTTKTNNKIKKEKVDGLRRVSSNIHKRK